MSYTCYFYPIVHPPAFWVCDLVTLPSTQLAKREISDLVGQCFSLIHHNHSQHCANPTSEVYLLPLAASPCLIPYTRAHETLSLLSKKPPNCSVSICLYFTALLRCHRSSLHKTNVQVSVSTCEDEEVPETDGGAVPRNMRVCNVTKLLFFKRVEAIYFMLCIFYHNLKKYIWSCHSQAYKPPL